VPTALRIAAIAVQFFYEGGEKPSVVAKGMEFCDFPPVKKPEAIPFKDPIGTPGQACMNLPEYPFSSPLLGHPEKLDQEISAHTGTAMARQQIEMEMSGAIRLCRCLRSTFCTAPC
jgi:hypothetical protein